jgi:hypothetical protein
VYNSLDEYLLATVPDARKEELKKEFDRLSKQYKK